MREMYRQIDHGDSRMAHDRPPDEDDLLDTLQRRTAGLVAQRLRSVSVVIARLRELIGAAHAAGHAHAAIHARLRAGGLAVSWNNYRASLVRARRRAAATVDANAAPAMAAPSQGAPLTARDGQAGSPAVAASSTPILDALAGARRAAARDYAPAARAPRRPREPRS